MNDVAVILDKAKKAVNAKSDADLARSLGVTRASVSNWRTGRNYPDTVQCATLAGLSGEPLAKVLGMVGAARAISRDEKAVWQRLAASAAALVLLLGAIPLPGQASEGHQRAGSASISRNWAGNTYYVRSLLGLWLRWLVSRYLPRRKPANGEMLALQG